MFNKKKKTVGNLSDRLPEFSYLGSDDIYMDSACQSIRPQNVIDSLNEYYQSYNACGGRVKYKWGQKVDSRVEETRDLVIDYLNLSKKDHVCSFTLNTTYGINLILTQLPENVYEQVVISEIEHNSVFLPTIELAKRLKIKRVVLKRDTDGSLIYNNDNLKKSVVVVNTVSNIDGQQLNNIRQLVQDTHKSGGIVIIDAAQTVAHNKDLISNCDADAICFSGHKIYAASLGVVVIKKSLLRILDLRFVGGGMVASVKENDYALLPDDMSSWLEPGLQAYGEIISLNTAIKWLQKAGTLSHINELSEKLYQGLSQIPEIIVINNGPSHVITLYSKNVDSHRLAIFLSASGIMVRSGYFCCHYYLLEKLKLPPLLRFSIGLHTTEDDVIKTIEIMKKITKG